MNPYEDFMPEFNDQEEDAVPQEEAPTKILAQTLLTERECKVESFIKDFCNEEEPSTLLDEAEEQAFLSEANNKLADTSLLLSHKYGTVLKAYLSRKQELEFTKSYSKLPKQILSQSNLAFVYSQCFAKWINSEHISFSTLHKTGLGQLTGKECFIVHLFSMATCRRVKGDDSFALSVVGRSSVGKTRIIEHCLQQASFTYASEPGVGRFNVKNRPILLYRDIEIDKLVKGADSSKFRTICRSEMTSVKVHSATVTLPPLWVMISANQRINSHSFSVPVKRKDTATVSIPDKKQKLDPSPSTSFANAFNWTSSSSTSKKAATKCFFNKPAHYPSQLVNSVVRLEESLKAIQNRVLELFVREKPDLTEAPLPNGTIFQRAHLIVGIFDTVLDILDQHSPEDFFSPVLVSYVLTGLCDNLKLYEANWPSPEAADKNKAKILSLVLRYVQDMDQQNAYLAKLGPDSL